MPSDNLEKRKRNYQLHRRWIANNQERSLKYHREYQKIYHKTDKFREYHRNYNRIKYKSDIQFKLRGILRSRIRLLYSNKSGSAVRDLGCTISELKFYLEGKFKDGMTWDNYGEWHVDHVIPLSFFDLEDREQFLKACHYTNLQPLWAKENMIKGNRIKLKELKGVST